MKRTIWWRTACISFIFTMGSIIYADQVNIIELPTIVNFNVTNVTQATSSGTTTISYDSASLTGTQKQLSISLQVNSPNFSPTAGTAIPVERIYWTGGTSGRLTNTSSQVTRVYLGAANQVADTVNITWYLDSLTGLSGLRADSQTLNATWLIESL